MGQSSLVLKTLHEIFAGVRISFTYSSIGIYSVRVRSSPHINPPGIASCASNELYYPQHGVCINDKCSKKSCGDYPVKYGEAICSGLDDGDSCKIQCDRGYGATIVKFCSSQYAYT